MGTALVSVTSAGLGLLLPLTDPEQSHYCLLKSQVRSQGRSVRRAGFGLPDTNWSTSHFFVSSSKGRGQERERVNFGTCPGIW